MEQKQARQYFVDLGKDLRVFPRLSDRKEWLELNKLTHDYTTAFNLLRAEHPVRRTQNPSNLDNIDPTLYQVSVSPAPIEFAPSIQIERSDAETLAINILHKYSDMPVNNKREIRARDRAVEEGMQRLLENPASIEAFSLLCKSEEKDNPQAKSLFEKALVILPAEVQKSWESLTSDQLKDLVQIYSRSDIASELTGRALRGYFKGPKGRKKVADANYKFVLGALDLIDDSQALETAVMIGSFQTDIVPFGSPYHLDLYSTNYVEVVDDGLLKRAHASDNIIFDLGYLTSLDMSLIRQRNTEMRIKNPAFDRKIREEATKYAIQYGYAYVQDKMKALHEVGAVTEFTLSPEERDQAQRIWPINVLLSTEDPLSQKYKQKAISRVISERLRKTTIEPLLKEAGVEKVTTVRLPIGEGIVLDTYIPAEIVSSKNEVLRTIMARAPLEDDLKAGISTDPSNSAIVFGNETVGGMPVYYLYRQEAGMEQDRHEINALEEIGFPIPQLPEDQVLGRVNNELADQINRRRLRYLNSRGVRIPVTSGALLELGYSFIDLKQNSDHPQGADVTVAVGDLRYKIKMDQNLNFDLEGKSLNSQHLSESLRYLMLGILDKVVCEEHIKSESGESLNDETTEIVSRMGHYRFLPVITREGERVFYTYTPRAEQLYAQYTGRSLALKSSQRKQDFGTDRNSTWVSPIIEADERLDPVIVNLPSVPGFN